MTATDFTGLDQRRRRLRYRLWHRGTREMDLIMGRFVDAMIGELADTDIGDLERLAEVPDPELYAWFSGAEPVPAAYDMGVFRRLRAFHSLEAPGMNQSHAG
jgi:antitoxin CptB